MGLFWPVAAVRILLVGTELPLSAAIPRPSPLWRHHTLESGGVAEAVSDTGALESRKAKAIRIGRPLPGTPVAPYISST